MMHTVLKFLKYKWLISQNIAHFSTYKNPNFNPKFPELGTKLQMSKLEETFSALEVFKYSTFG